MIRKADLNHKMGLSCIENYLIAALNKYSPHYEFLYQYSILSMEHVFRRICIDRVPFAEFYDIPRIQTLAKQAGIIYCTESSNSNTVDTLFSECSFCCVQVTNDYMQAMFGRPAWRDDHHVLLQKLGNKEFLLLNDNPCFEQTISMEEAKKLLEGSSFSFVVCNNTCNISPNLGCIYACLEKAISNRAILPTIDYTQLDLAIVRDFIGIMRILRRRLAALVCDYIEIGCLRSYLAKLDRLYLRIEYMRIREQPDKLFVLNELNEVWCEDNLVLHQLAVHIAASSH